VAPGKSSQQQLEANKTSVTREKLQSIFTPSSLVVWRRGDEVVHDALGSFPLMEKYWKDERKMLLGR
jgi:hypothetical protein